MIQQSSNMATTAVFEETNTDFDTSLMEFFFIQLLQKTLFPTLMTPLQQQ